MHNDRELDIVDELRFFAEAADSQDISLVMITGQTFTAAADEIEALRDRHDRAETHRNGTSHSSVPQYRNDHADETNQ